MLNEKGMEIAGMLYDLMFLVGQVDADLLPYYHEVTSNATPEQMDVITRKDDPEGAKRVVEAAGLGAWPGRGEIKTVRLPPLRPMGEIEVDEEEIANYISEWSRKVGLEPGRAGQSFRVPVGPDGKLLDWERARGRDDVRWILVESCGSIGPGR